MLGSTGVTVACGRGAWERDRPGFTILQNRMTLGCDLGQMVTIRVSGLTEAGCPRSVAGF